MDRERLDRDHPPLPRLSSRERRRPAGVGERDSAPGVRTTSLTPARRAGIGDVARDVGRLEHGGAGVRVDQVVLMV